MDDLIKILEDRLLDIRKSELDNDQVQGIWIKDKFNSNYEAKLVRSSDSTLLIYDDLVRRTIGIPEVNSFYILSDYCRHTNVTFYNFTTNINHYETISDIVYDQVSKESTEYVKKYKKFFDPITVRLFRELSKLRVCDSSPNTEAELTDKSYEIIIQPHKPCSYSKEYKILSISNGYHDYILLVKLVLVDESEVRVRFYTFITNVKSENLKSDFTSYGWKVYSDLGDFFYDPEVVCCKLGDFDIKKILREGIGKFLIKLPMIDPATSDKCLEIISKGIL